MSFARTDGRASNELRPVKITPGFLAYAEGSVLIEMGNTQVICAASLEERVPPFLRNTGQGWLTAEYAMLPRSTLTRTARETGRGGASGRTHEIQRLIGRSLRAVADMRRVPMSSVLRTRFLHPSDEASSRRPYAGIVVDGNVRTTLSGIPAVPSSRSTALAIASAGDDAATTMPV